MTCYNMSLSPSGLLCPQSGSRLQELVLVENTRLSEQYFAAVQKFVVLDLGLTLLPVAGPTEASQLIAQIVSRDRRFEFSANVKTSL